MHSLIAIAWLPYLPINMTALTKVAQYILFLSMNGRLQISDSMIYSLLWFLRWCLRVQVDVLFGVPLQCFKCDGLPTTDIKVCRRARTTATWWTVSLILGFPNFLSILSSYHCLQPQTLEQLSPQN